MRSQALDRILDELVAGPVNLDPQFFDEENRLQPDVRRVLLRVAEDARLQLSEKGFILRPAFVVLTGSLSGPNWDDQSDVDLHVGVDFNQYLEPEIQKRFLALFARDFNNNKFDLLGRSLELYFQDAHESHNSPGVYDVENDHWTQIPDGVRIEVTAEVTRAAEKYMHEVEALRTEYEEFPKVGAEKFLLKLQEYFEDIRRMRKEGLETEGRASFGNQLFKQLRRNGTLTNLTDLMRQVRDDVYEVFRETGSEWSRSVMEKIDKLLQDTTTTRPHSRARDRAQVLLSGGMTSDAVAMRIAQEFDIAYEVAHEIVQSFVPRLRRS